MKHPHLIPRKSGNKTYFHFRSKIPLNLISTFSGRKEFQISLKDVSNKETILFDSKKVIVEEEICNRIDGCRIIYNVCVACIWVK